MPDRPSARATALLAYLQGQHHGEKYLVAAQGERAAGELLLTGASVVPMGGFGGRAPFPTTDQLTQMITHGQLRFVLLTNLNAPNPQITDWVTGHCTVTDPTTYGGGQTIYEILYDCAHQ